MEVWNLFGYFIFLVMFMMSFVLAFYLIVYFWHNKESDFPKKTLISIVMVTGAMLAIFTNFLMIMDIISTSSK